jgi:glycosyltransferase involved in cell wall biosynthesis
MNNADHIIFVTRTARSDYAIMYPHLKDKMCVIYNGFDTDDLPSSNIKQYDKFTIAYSGSFYGLRTPETFFKSVRKIMKKNIQKIDFQILFVGQKNEIVLSLSKKYKVDVSFTGMVSQKKSVEYLSKSHMLLFIEYSESLPAKVFEYIAVNKPILAIGIENEAMKLIREYSNSYVITSDDVNRIGGCIMQCYNLWLKGKVPMINEEKYNMFVTTYNRENITKMVVDVFEMLT